MVYKRSNYVMIKIFFTLMFMLVSINSIAKSYDLNIPDSCYITFAIDDSKVKVIDDVNKKVMNIKGFCDLYIRSPLANTWTIEYAVQKWNENTRKVIATHNWNRSDWNYNVKPDYTITVKVKEIRLYTTWTAYDVDIFVTDENGNTVCSIIRLKSVNSDIDDIYTHRDMMKNVAKILAKSINKKTR